MCARRGNLASAAIGDVPPPPSPEFRLLQPLVCENTRFNADRSHRFTVRKTIGFYRKAPFQGLRRQRSTTPSEQQERRLASGIAPGSTSAALVRGIAAPARPPAQAGRPLGGEGSRQLSRTLGGCEPRLPFGLDDALRWGRRVLRQRLQSDQTCLTRFLAGSVGADPV